MLHNDHAAKISPRLPWGDEAAQAFAEWTRQWHMDTRPLPAAAATLQQLHRANFALWHLEDSARDASATDSIIAGVKRSIDKTNQSRNDLVEQVDLELLQILADEQLPHPAAPLHSETPGMMLDRLSILALKLFHTAEEADRSSATEKHRQRNRERLCVLQQQSSDLAGCLSMLWQQVTQGTRGYRLYRQLKMYNDPELNPVLYSPTMARTPPA